MGSFVKSLLIYYGVPLAAARIWGEKKIQTLEKELFKEIYRLPNDINRDLVTNLVRNGQPALIAINKLATDCRRRSEKQLRIN
jgi:hypothetical protein